MFNRIFLSKGMQFSRKMQTDVLIIGGGNAALCAAMTARETGVSVLIIESAPSAFRGGNSRHTRNLRYVHDSDNEHLTGPYLEEEFWNDILQVTDGQTNEKLAQFLINESRNIGIWMTQHGCHFQPSMRGTLHLSRTNAFFLGGGKALINAYYTTALKLGVKILYETEAQDIEIRNGEFISATAISRGAAIKITAKAVVIASGGFQANIEWLKKFWGEHANNFVIRGSPYNKGRMLQALFDLGVKPVGNPRQCHAIAVDARAPKFDGGIVTRLDCIPFGIVVNKHAERFYDEGENFWPKRYAIWGRLIAQQPEQIAYSIIDSKSLNLFMPSVFPPIKTNSIIKMALKLKLNPSTLKNTVSVFNSSIRSCKFDPYILDNCRTLGLFPPKSHWACPLDTPPFYGYPLRPGITFTYHSVAVNEKSQILMLDETPASNIFAAGEIMSGNILGKGYLAGLGMTIGTVFGKIAGKEAARYASQ